MQDDIFIRKIQDLYRLCEKHHAPKFSEFLEPEKQALLKKERLDSIFFGGYDGAERCMMGVFPKWQEPQNEDFPIQVLEFTKKYDKELSHRHYLGTILSLGLDRSRIGDILTGDKKTYVFLSGDIAELVKDGITKVAGCGVSVRICDLSEVVIPEKKFELIETVAGSMRLDAVVASALKLSRSEAKTFIQSGRASVNHTETMQTDFILCKKDLLSLKGFGRYEVLEVGGRTRSDRIHVTLKKYI